MSGMWMVGIRSTPAHTRPVGDVDVKRFYVPAQVAPVHGRAFAVVGNGCLSTAPGHLALQLGSWSARRAGTREVEHVGQSVRVVTCRLMVPWIGTRVVVRGADRRGNPQTGIALFPTWSRRAVIDALRSAGFVVTVESEWLRSRLW